MSALEDTVTVRTARRNSHFRTIIDGKPYIDLYTRRSDLTNDIADHIYREIQLGDVWGYDPVLLTNLQNAHVGVPNPSGGDGFIYPDGPISVYKFMKGPQGEIPLWIQKKLPPKPPSTEGESPVWTMEDIPDPIIMSAAATVSLKLRDLRKPPACDGTSIGYMDRLVDALLARTGQSARMYKLTKTAEVAACQEYLSDNPSKDVINTFFSWCDVMTRPRGYNTRLGSEEFVREVVPEFHRKWEGYRSEADVTHSDYLLSLDSRLEKIPELQQKMTEAGQTGQRSARLANPAESNFDYVGRYESLKETDMETSNTDTITRRTKSHQELWNEVQEKRRVDVVEESEDGHEDQDLFTEIPASRKSRHVTP